MRGKCGHRFRAAAVGLGWGWRQGGAGDTRGRAEEGDQCNCGPHKDGVAECGDDGIANLLKDVYSWTCLIIVLWDALKLEALR